MSWSFSVNPTPRAKFQAALDAAEVIGSNGTSPNGAKQVAAAKKAITDMAKLVKRHNVSATATGHAWSAEDGAHFFDGFSVTVSGSE